MTLRRTPLLNEDRVIGNAKNVGGRVEEGFGRAAGDVKSQVQGSSCSRTPRSSTCSRSRISSVACAAATWPLGTDWMPARMISAKYAASHSVKVTNDETKAPTWTGRDAPVIHWPI